MRGRSQSRYCIAHIWCWPTPVVQITSSRSAVSRCSVSRTRWGLSSSPVAVAERELLAPRLELAQPGLRPRRRQRAQLTRRSSASTCFSGPTTGTSAWRSFPISAASTSRWTTVAPGAKAESLPVTRSSKRAPTATSTSQVFIARFDHFGPCMPGQPKCSSCVSGKALFAISVVTTGKPPRLGERRAARRTRRRSACRRRRRGRASRRRRSAAPPRRSGAGGRGSAASSRGGRRCVRVAEVELVLLEVARDVDEHRPAAAGAGDVEGGLEHVRDLLDVLHEPGVLDDRRRHAGDVALLEGVGADQVAPAPGR